MTVIPIDPVVLVCLIITGVCLLLGVWLDRWDKANRRPTDEVALMLWTCKRLGPTLPEQVQWWMIGWCDHAFRSHLPPVIRPDKNFFGHGKNAPPEDKNFLRGPYEMGYRASRDRNGYPCP